ncbi:hypothetical protein [Rhodococcus sp. KBS0724]|uniref:hypothetical protein n=1 Tax=Rhodococcus sp. KBS0724 TaxID=1179674 RepID=UPI00163D7D60|nr:hypothetical protein [Rhodococcus sp. KBS0724]
MDYTTCAAFNCGRPDVVFMVHDPGGGLAPSGWSGRYVNSYDDGIDAVHSRLGL